MAPAHIAYALTNRKNLFVAGPVRPHLNRFVASGSSTTMREATMTDRRRLTEKSPHQS